MRSLTLFYFLSFSLTAFAQSSADYSVMLEANAVTNSSINLTWDTDNNASGYTVYRKNPSDALWGSPLAFPGALDTSFLDNTVSENTDYEYKIVKSASGYTGYGYVHAGINLELPAFRGDLLLVVEETIALALAAEIDGLVLDLEGDGWRVKQIHVPADTTAIYVKGLIKNEYQGLDDLQMVYLLGHVPVPYAGNINPDAHPNHQGAWPADVYYAEMDGLWTDNSVSNSSSANIRNHNEPGDGKLDQSILPSDAELMIGRVDFADMPSFTQDETTLLRQYLDRVHAYKQGLWTLPKRALVDDNFGGFSGEAFGANAWRNFSPLVGRDSIQALDYRTTLNNEGYLFSYGCGGGSYTSAGGIGNSSQLAGDSLQTGFTMLFGSYFGDWNYPDNFMRAALAQGQTMSISWAGRPHWFYQSMGMGYPIGYSAKLSQNNQSTYMNQVNYGTKWVHVALLGDPSLRMEYVQPPIALAADTVDTFHVALSWTDSPDNTVQGYNIYRSENDGDYFKVNTDLIAGLSYTDSCVLNAGEYTYMVKAVKLIKTYSGAYFNESLGSRASLMILADKNLNAVHSATQQSPNSPLMIFSAQSMWASQIEWLLGDTVLLGHDVEYSSSLQSNFEHPYQVVFKSACSTDTLSGEYIWHLSSIEGLSITASHIYPNPVKSGDEIVIGDGRPTDEVLIFTMTGQLVKHYTDVSQILTLDLSPGVYLVKTQIGVEERLVKLIVQR